MRSSVTAVVVVLLASVFCSCQPGDADGPPPGWRKEQARRVKGLEERYGLRISKSEYADIRIVEEEEGTRVTFADRTVERIGGACLSFLDFDEPEKLLDEDDYAAFLEDLDGYLMLNPPADIAAED